MRTVERLNRAEQQRRTRERVLDAAEQLFAERGFAATSVAAVAERAGFTKGAVYANFDGKDDLVLALFSRRVTRRWEETSSAVRPEMTPAQAVAAMACRYVEVMRADREWSLLFLEFSAYAARSPVLRTRLAEHNAAALDHMTARITEAGLGPGLDPRAYAQAVFVVTTGTALEDQFDHVADEVPALLLYFLEAGLRASPALPEFARALRAD